MRFLLIDRITAWQPGRRGCAVKCVALSEDVFADHFPNKPIMPGVLLLEGMAQLAGLLLEAGVRDQPGRETSKALMSIVERLKFRAPVWPGDRLDYEAEVLSCNEAGGRVQVTARREGQAVADGILVFSFHPLADPHLEAHRARILALWHRDREDAAAAAAPAAPPPP